MLWLESRRLIKSPVSAIPPSMDPSDVVNAECGGATWTT